MTSTYSVKTVADLAATIAKRVKDGDQLTVVNIGCDDEAGYQLIVIRKEAK